jgi:hypothetical protein
MVLPEKSNQTFCFHHRKAQHDVAGNLGAIFELMSQGIGQKIATKSFWGRQQGEFLQKNISLHGMANDRFFSIKRKPGKCIIDASPLVDSASPHPCSLKQNSVSIFAFSLLAVTYHSTSGQDRYVFSTKSTPLRRGSKKPQKLVT